MVKTYFNKNRGTTTVVLRDNDMDAVNKVLTRLGIRHLVNDTLPDTVSQQLIKAFELSKLVMPSDSKATVTVREGDTFDETTGAQEALAKAQKNYRQSMRKAFRRWQVAMMKKIYRANPDTYMEALKEVEGWIEDKR